ncbi:MAG: signal peptide peptidase SppA [Alloprevotella sp.]|nr:signal peptide peptidase SppA [Bacteroidales bacterium]MDY2779278.1 signal peptide peptidase SppA [Alloprevotella sp.]
MKAFFKQVLAVIVGSLIVSVFTSVMFLVMFFSMLASADQRPNITQGTVLHLNLNGMVEERHTASPFDAFFNSEALNNQGLNDILKAIKVAAKDDRIEGIYIEAGLLSADFATVEEIRKALTDFKKTGKFVMAYGENYTQGAYYVASVADSIYINPGGMIDWRGIAATPMFYKELLDKIGVKMQVFRVGTYKSAVEPYTGTEMSEANREQMQSFINDIWTVVCKDVSASRNIPVDSLNAIADSYATFADVEDYVKKGLVDGTAYVDEVRDRLQNRVSESLNLVEAADLALCYEDENDEDGEIAIYYAYGDIVGAEGGGLMGGGALIVGPDVVKDLDQLAQDDNVKAVVLRINSGGGSAFASEQIWRAVEQLKKKKPVIVSMGGYAASGGYYMACGADFIMAEPTTLTGSIGIFGMVPDLSGLMTEKLGLHVDVVKTNEASDFGVIDRPFTAAESQAMQQYVERGYQLFLKRVADGRNLSTAYTDSIAQGRVWTGRQALNLKLVDKLGTLDDAIKVAAKKAQITHYRLVDYPAPANWFDQMMGDYKDDYMEREVKTTLGHYYQPLRFVLNLKGTDCLQARMPFEPQLH